jgi:uncharacterized protein YeeX (DUF496 family)
MENMARQIFWDRLPEEKKKELDTVEKVDGYMLEEWSEIETIIQNLEDDYENRNN